MKITATPIPAVLILEPRVFQDDRGFFLESFNQRVFQETTQLDYTFVQDNHSRSTQGILRGLHYQLEHTQGKLVRVASGSIYDVAVDLRRSSPTFGQWVGTVLSAENQQQLWVPPGFAHGFYVISDQADVLYKTTDYYHPASERTLAWNDAQIGIDWPLTTPPILSAKDQTGLSLETALETGEVFP
ncbi:dTDP-4-dehydrorhamnose 3,5-epimerase [Leptolyngbya sp. PCC 6406]|uniref:dTDP-4-dehydrorhamnose 3,5-epimerase n=1 Tax=Leptolyngbya sp. PCC 6406 TaxID=1173264 RepID=UPI0002ACA1A1|nr:dTDP-4-dehydrorhamnose 3,5-epimerase [Leptolyngbya sp. PCC 6406]